MWWKSFQSLERYEIWAINNPIIMKSSLKPKTNHMRRLYTKNGQYWIHWLLRTMVCNWVTATASWAQKGGAKSTKNGPLKNLFTNLIVRECEYTD